MSISYWKINFVLLQNLVSAARVRELTKQPTRVCVIIFG